MFAGEKVGVFDITAGDVTPTLLDSTVTDDNSTASATAALQQTVRPRLVRCRRREADNTQQARLLTEQTIAQEVTHSAWRICTASEGGGALHKCIA